MKAAVSIALAALMALGVWLATPLVDVAAGYAARILCSSVLVSGESVDWAMENRIRFAIWPVGRATTVDVDPGSGRVRARILGRTATARYQPGRGCTLLC